MKFRKFSMASLISALLVFCTLGLWLLTFMAVPSVSLSQNFHVAAWHGFSGDTLGRLIFWNDAEYGPYRGSIISFGSDKDPPPKFIYRWEICEDCRATKEIDFDDKGKIQITATVVDLPGIYYRHFQWPDRPQPLWTLMMSLWYLFFFFSILPILWITHHRRSRRLKRPSG